jgi:hypothetical protein
MTRDEYEQRRKGLEEQLRAGIHLLHAAHAEQLRALDLLWGSASGEAPETAAAPSQEAPRRRRAGELSDEVIAALARCPEVFDTAELCRALGYEPNRGTLHRLLGALRAEGLLAVETRGSGRVGTRYRKL